MAPRPLLRSGALAAALAVGAMACGDDGGGATAASTTTAAEATTTTAAAAGSTSTSVDLGDPEEGLGDLESLVPQLLIVAADLGPDVDEIGFRPPEVVDCAIDDEHPVDVLAGTGLEAATQLVEEVIRVYPSPDAAEAAFDAWVAFPSDCTYGLGVAMGTPTDANDQVGADRSVRFHAARDGDATATLFVALVGDSIIATSVVGTPGLDPDEVAAFAVGKVLAALEA